MEIDPIEKLKRDIELLTQAKLLKLKNHHHKQMANIKSIQENWCQMFLHETEYAVKRALRTNIELKLENLGLESMKVQLEMDRMDRILSSRRKELARLENPDPMVEE